MMNKVIIDTNVLVGLYDKKDVWHKQAKKLIQRFKETFLDLIIPDCVVNETFTVLARRLSERKDKKILVTTLKRVKATFPKSRITNSYQLIETKYDALIDRIIKSNGKINFHDALIITFAINQSIPFIASFDEDFDGITGVTRICDLKNFSKNLKET